MTLETKITGIIEEIEHLPAELKLLLHENKDIDDEDYIQSIAEALKHLEQCKETLERTLLQLNQIEKWE